MLKIRLMKPGKSVKRRSAYKIVIMEQHAPRDSSFSDQVGHYNPIEKLLKIDIEKYQKWIKKGAQPTDTVRALYKRYNKQLAKAKTTKVNP